MKTKEFIKQIIVKEWNDEMKEWEKTVKIIRWEHDYIENYYKVDFEEKTI